MVLTDQVRFYILFAVMCVKIFPLLALYDGEYTLTGINALKQFWKTNRCFSCLGKPKAKNMLLYLDRCKAEYTLKNGTTITAGSGSVIYTPLQSEYKVRFFGFEDANSCTVGINFLLLDSENTSCVLDDTVRVFRPDNANYKVLFHQISRYSEANIVCRGKVKSILYDLIFQLSGYFKKERGHSYRMIEKGISFLEQNDEQYEDQKLTIREIAELCHVSEVYFRKMFKAYSGMSPAQYRINARLCKAKHYLSEQELNISEIAAKTGFDDASYFIATFKRHTGMTPREYRAGYCDSPEQQNTDYVQDL